MGKHIVTKSRAIGVSHYKTTELPVNVLAKEPKGSLFLQGRERESDLQKLIRHMINELRHDLA